MGTENAKHFDASCNDKRVHSLVEEFNYEHADIVKIVLEVGVHQARVVCILANKFGIPLQLAKELAVDPDIVRALSKHAVLQDFIRKIPEDLQISLGKRDVRLRLASLYAGHNSSGAMDCSMRFVDAHSCVFPSAEDEANEKELEWLQLSSKGETQKKQRLGAIGHVDFTLGLCEGRSVQFILNGQARKYFWALSNNIRNSYRRWYEKGVEALTDRGRDVGVQSVIVPSVDMVNASNISGWGHKAPDSILLQFYDRYAEKRDFRAEILEIVHPVTGARMKGKVWVKDLPQIQNDQVA